MFARRGAGRNGSSTSLTIGQYHFSFTRWVATRIKNLTSYNLLDPTHTVCSSKFNCCEPRYSPYQFAAPAFVPGPPTAHALLVVSLPAQREKTNHRKSQSGRA